MGTGSDFFCLVNHATFRQLCNGRFLSNLVSKRTSVSRRGIRKDTFENFHFRGHLPPKSEIENRSNRHLTQSRPTAGHGTHCRDILFTPHCSPRAREFPGSDRLFCTTYDCGAPGRQFPNFRILAYFPHTEPQKRTFRWPAYSPGVTSQNASDFSVW